MVYSNLETKWKIIMLSAIGCDECAKVYPLANSYCVKNNIEFQAIPIDEYSEWTPPTTPGFILQKNGETVLKTDVWLRFLKKMKGFM